MFRLILIFLIIKSLFSQEIGQASYPQVEGKIVRNITVENQEIFNDNPNWLYRQVNNIKVNTKKAVILRELSFKKGDKLTELIVKESARNLRSLKFIDQIKITPFVDGDYVDITISVKETWTFIPTANYSNTSGIKSRSIGLEDSNFLGWGKRFELLQKDEDSRSSVEAVWDDRRFLGSNKNLVLGYFDREDGDRYYFNFDNPIRTLLDRTGWGVTIDKSNFIGRLFDNGDEVSIFKTNFLEVSSQYIYSKGSPESLLKRYGFGYSYTKNLFSEATDKDYESIDVDRDKIDSSIPLPLNRRFSGPTFNYSRIKANYIPINYIDRFDRYEDYNIGQQVSLKTQYAPEFLGSLNDSYLNSVSVTKGWCLSDLNFIRTEARLGNRFEADGIKNNLLSLELKHYKILGRKFLFGLPIGRHTLASNIGLDLGHELDTDVQLLAGADNSLRGYDARTFSGDKRIIFNFEDRIHIYNDIAKLISLGSAFFVDVGATTNDSTGDLFTDRLYGDVGFGLRIGFPRSSGGRVLRLDVAFPLRNSPGEEDVYDPRFVVSAGQIFSSFFTSETNRNSPQVSSLYGLGN